ncbi:Glutaredoxin [Spraguea lophii 42_110]|uniref:Glutaredoxin n=1 Tax=Spraguea lophii (strain 42_110) TaxID=1358809 RepID=S7W5H0_SPRLO|nr:Glutaredoxin [Spraguea lophii 42_110]
MAEENLNNEFFILSQNNNIIAHDNDESIPQKFFDIIDNDKYILIDLKTSDTLKEAFIKYFGVKKLPVLISYNVRIYDDRKINEKKKRRDSNLRAKTNEIIENTINSSKIVIFIKGTPERPECKFSRALINLFDEMNLVNGRDYNYYNIFLNNHVRSLLKEINSWPTFPQVYIDKVFCGGLDILKQMKDKKVLEKMIFE